MQTKTAAQERKRNDKPGKAGGCDEKTRRNGQDSKNDEALNDPAGECTILLWHQFRQGKLLRACNLAVETKRTIELSGWLKFSFSHH